jgi:YD repeat-containing protein
MRPKYALSVVSALVALSLVGALSASAAEQREQRGFQPNNIYQVGEIDSVNVSNGDVIVRIPIGQQYSVGPTLRYQFTLTYNSKVWDYGPGSIPGDPGNVGNRVSLPEKRSNAGFGWLLSLGRLIIDKDNVAPFKERGWSYEAPDGAEYRFETPNRDDTTLAVLYAFSGQYLRLRRLGTTSQIDFPNGEIHTFDADGNLTRMQDQFGNWVEIKINGTRWTVTDGYGSSTDPANIVRTHYIDHQDVSALYPFPANPKNFGSRVTGVDLQTFDGARAPYTLSYADNASIGYGGGGDQNPRPCLKGPLLTSILLPDGTSYTPLYKEIPQEQCKFWAPNDESGTLTKLDLPTGGFIDWEHGSYPMQSPECLSPTEQFGIAVQGVTRRTYNDGRGNERTWKYTPQLGPDEPHRYTGKDLCGESNGSSLMVWAYEYFTNTIEAPDGLVTRHYVSMWPSGHPFGSNSSQSNFDGEEFGLPISHTEERGELDEFSLSTEVFDCTGGCPRDAFQNLVLTGKVPVKRTFLSYARLGLMHNGAPWSSVTKSAAPWMVVGEMTETEIDADGDAAKFTKTEQLQFDGYGNFGATRNTNNFTGVDEVRLSTVTRQRNILNGNWLLGMYSDSLLEEGSLVTRTKTEFDLTTGFRKSMRTYADPDVEQGHDLLTIWCRNTSIPAGARGFVTGERHLGGDHAPIPAAGTDVCAPGATRAGGHYYIDHTYRFSGAKLTGHSAQFAGTPFLSVDEDYDTNTGMVKTTRDSAGISTTFKYDVMGRLLRAMPEGQAWTRYRYDLAADPPAVHVDVWPASVTEPPENSWSGALNDQHYYYNGLGQLLLAKTRMPGESAWAAVATTYDATGRVASVTIPAEAADAGFQSLPAALKKTTSSYDIFGRTTKTIAPDGSEVRFSYAGDRARTRTQEIWNGTAKVEAHTTEESDGFGRLRKVTESSKSDGTNATTKYEYVMGDRLREVTIDGAQKREFHYDLRGFLGSESHPESGSTSYTYDARGNVVTKTAASPAFNLAFDYDGAGRPVTISGGSGPLKTFVYGPDNGTDDFRKGKLVEATRFNYPVAAGQPTIKVVETYRYRRAEGRQTDRTTEIFSGATLLKRFDQSEHFDQLDQPDLVTYPKCTLCGIPPRESVRTHYDYGRIVKVDEAVDSITYHPNGLWLERKHANKIVDVQTPDPSGMPRPAEIKAVVPATCSVITGQPEDRSIQSGQSASFTVIAPANATFQWYQGPRGDTRRPISGATTSTLSLQSVATTTTYWCRVTTPECAEDSRSVTVDTCKLILAEPQPDAVDQGGAATLSVTPVNAGSTFQWYKGLRGDVTSPVPGATASALPLTGLTVTESYWCRVRWVDPNNPSNVCTQDSVTATVTVCAPYSIVEPAADASPSTAVKDQALTFRVVATGQQLSYAWYWRLTTENVDTKHFIGNGTEIEFAPAATTAPDQQLLIWVEVRNGCTMKSRTVAKLTVITLPPCKVQMDLKPYELDQLLPGQQSILKATMRVAPAAGLEVYTDIKYRFRWFKEGELVQNYLHEGTPASETDTVQHHETATNGFHVGGVVGQTWTRLEATVICSTATNTFTSAVDTHKSFIFEYGHCPVPEVTVDPAEAVLRDTGGITLKADSIYPWADYKWYQGESGNTSNEVFQGNTASITVVEAGTYWVRASSDCAHVDSETVVVGKSTGTGVCTPVRFLSDPQDQTIAAFQPVTLSVDANADPAPTTFLWRTRTENVINAGSTITLNPGPRKTTDYSVRVRNACSLEDSAWARVHVTSCADMTIVQQPQDLSVSEHDVVTLNILATSVAQLRYQWYAGESGDTTNPIGGLTPTDPNWDSSKHGPTLNLGKLTANGRYWVRLSFDDPTRCEVDSRTAAVTVCAAPRIVNAPNNRVSTVPGLDQSFEVGVTGQNLSYAWYKGTNTSDETQPPLSTKVALLVHPTQTTSYWVKVTSDCVQPFQDPVVRIPFTVSVCPLIRDGGRITAAKTLVSSGTTTTLSINVDRGDFVEWYMTAGSGAPVKFAEGAQKFSAETPQITQNATFFARATSGSCTRESEPLLIEVCTSPTVHWTHGIPTRVEKGATFYLTAGLTPGQTANFRFYRGTTRGDVAGSTLVHGSSNQYQVHQLQTTTSWWVRAFDDITGCFSDSEVRTVTVCVPTITAQPQSVTINANTSTTLTVTTDNLPGVTYQWYIGQPGDTSNLLAGKTSNTLTVSPSANTTYWVRATGCGADPVHRDSQAATVSICKPPDITTDLTPKSLPRNYDATLSIAASGDGLHYQWFEGAAGVTTKPVGTDSNSYSFRTTLSTRYWVRVTGNCGTKNSASPPIDVEPELTAHPAGGLVVSGTTRTLTVAANGTGLTYAWYQRTASGSTPVAGQTSASFPTPPITANVTYYARVCSGAACSNSSDAVLQVCTTPTVHWSSGNPTQVANGQTFSLSAGLAAGETASWRWYRGSTSGDVTNSTLVYTTAGTYQVNNIQATTSYWVRALNESTGCYSDSTVRTVSVCIPTITAQPQPVTINANSSTTLTVTTDNLPGVTYQWYIGQPGITTNPITGQTSASLTVTPAATTTYWVRVTGCVTRDSTAATVTICQVPNITTPPAGGWMTTSSTRLTVAASGTELTYQWFKGLSGDTSLPQSSTTTYIDVSPSTTTNYWVRVSGRCGTPVNSATAKVSVKPSIGVHPAGGPATKGVARTLSVTASGTELSYQWYQRPASGPATAIPGATAASYTTPALMADATYYVRVFSGVAYAESNDATFTICLPREINVVGYGTGRSGDQVTLQVINPAADEQFEWYRGAAGVTSDPLGAGTVKYVTPAATTSYWVRTRRTSCDADSAVVTITICYPNITTQPEASSLIAANTTKTLTVAATGTAPLVYQWYRGAVGDTSAPVGTNSPAFTSPALTASTSYWVRISTSSTACTSKFVNSQQAVVNVCQPPVITSQPPSQIAPRNITYTLSVAATGDNLHYQWYEGDSGVTTTPVGTDSNQLSVHIGATRKYWVRISGTCGTVDSATALQSVKPGITQHPTTADVCGIGGNATFTVSASGAQGYRWYRWTPGAGTELVGTTQTLVIAVSNASSTFHAVAWSGDAVAGTQVVGVNILAVPSVNSFTATQENATRWLLQANVAAADQGLVRYRFYEGALGDTTTLLVDTATYYTRVYPATRPKTYWVEVYYDDTTKCGTRRAVTIN